MCTRATWHMCSRLLGASYIACTHVNNFTFAKHCQKLFCHK